MNISGLFITILLFGEVICGAELTPVAEDGTISEFRSLMAIAPATRTNAQKERIRDIWRSSGKVREFFHGASVLRAGDSVFDFPGVIQGRDITYDGTKKEYNLKADYSVESADGGEDHWSVTVVFSENGIVTDRRQFKMNSR